LGQFEAALVCIDTVLEGSEGDYLCTVQPATGEDVEYFWAYSAAYSLRINALQNMGRQIDEKLLVHDSECGHRRETLKRFSPGIQINKNLQEYGWGDAR